MRLLFSQLREGDRFMIAPNGPTVYTKINEEQATANSGRKDTFVTPSRLEVIFQGNHRLKMTFEDQWIIREAVGKQDTGERRADYIAGRFPNADRCQDKNRRYRWDLLWASKLKIGDGDGMPGLPLYAYLNDAHIDTALRSIVPDLTPAQGELA